MKKVTLTSFGAANRADLTEKVPDIKRENGWTWKYICEQIGGMSPMLVCARASAPARRRQLPRVDCQSAGKGLRNKALR
jgi:hypothetical protein